jgi:phage shock protein A
MACAFSRGYAQQDSTAQTLRQIPSKFFSQADDKIDKYGKRITGKTEKTLTKLSRWENKVRSLLQKASPETADRLFAPGVPTFASLLQQLKKGEVVAAGYKAGYDQYRDNLTTGIKYLAGQKALLDSNIIQHVSVTSAKMDALQDDVAQSEAVEKFIRERKKQLINESIRYIGKSKYLSKINKESYYYAETLKNYKAIFSDPKKAEKTAVELLNKIPAFKNFMRQNSMLASLFRQPGDADVQSLAGLQTRAGINSLIAGRLAAGGPNAREMFSQNMQNAQAQLNALKEKISKAGASGDDNLPDFKPNNQKTKTFFQRLAFGNNLQFARSNSLLPTTADIGLSMGYKLNDKSVIGLGGSYKMGMGSIQHFSITHQGIGVRSFIEWKLKKQFFVSGGYELNHLAAFNKISQLKDINNWQRAGLIGISKKVPMKTKLVKNASVQLLFDVLCRDHVPVSQPVLFRMGYGF